MLRFLLRGVKKVCVNPVMALIASREGQKIHSLQFFPLQGFRKRSSVKLGSTKCCAIERELSLDNLSGFLLCLQYGGRWSALASNLLPARLAGDFPPSSVASSSMLHLGFNQLSVFLIILKC